MRALLLPVLLGLSSTLSPQGLVWVVDDDAGPGVDFADIQSAVDAASDGDCVLVRAGAYDAFVVTAKSLTVVGGSGGVLVGDPFAAFMEPSVDVELLGPGQSVVLANLDVASGFLAVGVDVSDCQGPVWMEDVQAAGVAVAACDQVVVVGCSLTTPSFFGGFLPATLQCASSAVQVYDTSMTGAHGALGCASDADGGPGMRVTGGTAFLSGSTLVGGDGGEVLSCTIFTGYADGGDGLIVDGAGARVVDSQLVGGAAGFDCCPGTTPQPGDDVVLLDGGTVEDIPGVARSIALASPVSEGTPATVSYLGDGGDLVLLVSSFVPQVLELGGVVGPLVLGLPWATALPGLLPASGELNLPVQIPGLVNPLLEFRTYYLQGAFLSTQGTAHLSAPTAVVVVDASIAL